MSCRQQAKLMESYGANCIYCTDSAGYMLPGRRDGAHQRVARAASVRHRDRLPRPPQHGDGHRELAGGDRGGRQRASTARLAGLGAGAGNTPLEVFNAVCAPHGHRDRRRCVQAHGRRRGPRRADDGSARSASTATRSSSATPVSTRPSCCLPSARGASTACLRPTSWSSSAA